MTNTTKIDLEVSFYILYIKILYIDRVGMKKIALCIMHLCGAVHSIQTYDTIQKYAYRRVPYTSLLHNIEDHSVSKIYFSKDMTRVISEDNTKDNTELYTITPITPLITNNLVDVSIKNDVEPVFFEVPPVNPVQSVLSSVGGFVESSVAPVLALTVFVSFLRSLFMFQRMNSRTNSPLNKQSTPFQSPFQAPFPGMNFNQEGFNTKEELKKRNITLSSFAGSPEIFEECTEVVSYLKNATVYQNAGAEIPRGILLDGPPGTGKTLLAKAIASEADANFISISASEFVEVFVGVGALKIRNLFQNARQNLPCIVFIDEIDSIGRQRGVGMNMGNDEREQTLNQLLAEMDGFTNNNGILVMAATNRKDILDTALLRPGRFDRIITVPLPDRNSRKEILKVHSKNKQLEPSISLDWISEMTSGFSGAQLKNLLNEAAIYAARNSRTVLTEQDLLSALDKEVVGLVRKSETRCPEALERVAIHEMGHAFLCHMFPEYFDLKKVSIQSTYNGAGGYTLFQEHSHITESGLYTKDLMKKRLTIALGGKAAEFIYYGENHISLGAIQDLKQANSLAQRMIGQYGMGETLKVFYNENMDGGRAPLTYSDKTREVFDQESLQLVQEAYQDAVRILLENREKMDELIQTLLMKSILYGNEIDSDEPKRET